MFLNVVKNRKNRRKYFVKKKKCPKKKKEKKWVKKIWVKKHLGKKKLGKKKLGDKNLPQKGSLSQKGHKLAAIGLSSFAGGDILKLCSQCHILNISMPHRPAKLQTS